MMNFYVKRGKNTSYVRNVKVAFGYLTRRVLHHTLLTLCWVQRTKTGAFRLLYGESTMHARKTIGWRLCQIDAVGYRDDRC